MTKHPDWLRVSRTRPCPVCSHPDWCAVAESGEVALCQRVESSKRVGAAGWLHSLAGSTMRDRTGTRRTARLRVSPGVDRVDGADPRDTSGLNWAEFAQQYAAATDGARLQRLATALGLSAHSLRRLGTGWLAAYQAWTFPMSDASGAVLGIRLRRPSGRKLTIAGGHEGLFIPKGLDTAGQVVIAEGPTDCAALLDLGFSAIGRPSCSGGTRLLVECIRKWRPATVVILSDSDGPGIRGAEALVLALATYHRDVRMIAPPSGIKDARAWKQAGAMCEDVKSVIAAAEPHVMRLVSVRGGVARGR